MLKAVSILMFTAFISVPASAHSGNHHFADILTTLLHFFSEPVHGGALIVLAAGGLALRSSRKRLAHAIIRHRP